MKFPLKRFSQTLLFVASLSLAFQLSGCSSDSDGGGNSGAHPANLVGVWETIEEGYRNIIELNANGSGQQTTANTELTLCDFTDISWWASADSVFVEFGEDLEEGSAYTVSADGLSLEITNEEGSFTLTALDELPDFTNCVDGTPTVGLFEVTYNGTAAVLDDWAMAYEAQNLTLTFSAGNEYITIGIFNIPAAVGTYDIGGDNNPSIIAALGEDDLYMSSILSIGTLTIASMSETNVQGTFSATVPPPVMGDDLILTNGSFDLEISATP